MSATRWSVDLKPVGQPFMFITFFFARFFAQEIINLCPHLSPRPNEPLSTPNEGLLSHFSVKDGDRGLGSKLQPNWKFPYLARLCNYRQHFSASGHRLGDLV